MEGNFVSPVSFDWDDSELIKIYNESMMKVKDKIQNDMANGGSAAKSSNKKSGRSKISEECGNKMKEWVVGDLCQALYSEDGELYEAEILEIPDVDTYLVKFIGYGNEEIVYGSDVHPSKGGLVQEEQKKAATLDWDIFSFCSAPYTVDGKWYEAQIIGFPNERTCSVRFIAYENVEIVPLNRLRPSGGDLARLRQTNLAEGQQKEFEETLDDELSSLSSHYSSRSEASNARMVREPAHQSPVISHRALSQTESNEFVPSVTSQERNECRHRRSSSRPLYTTHPSSPPTSMIPLSYGGHEDNEAFSALLMSWYMAGYHTGFYQGRNRASRCSCNNCRRRFRN